MEAVLNEDYVVESNEMNVDNNLAEGDDLWSNFETAGINLNETTEPEEEAEPEEPEKETQTEQNVVDEDTPDFLDIKYNHEEKKLSKKEARTLAQMGMNYGKIKGELDDANVQNAKYKQYEDFLNELKGDFPTVEDLMIDTRARMMMKKDGNISFDEAMAKAKANAPKPIDKRRASADAAVKQFTNLYGNIKSEDIPKEVWNEVKITGDLAKAYHSYEKRKYEQEIADLKQQLESEKTNNKNAARSSGSSKSSGASKNTKSMLDSIWDNI